MAIEIKSFNQILGTMVRKIVAETPVSDINPGSVFLSLLEACVSNDYENRVAILNILELLSIDSIRNEDLDNKAADFGLVRNTATPATGTVTIYNTNIAKQSSSLYSLKPAPIAGQTVLFLTKTDGWASQGSLYIGRGTASFEGPIPYTDIQHFSTYSQVTLGTALQKDHLNSDLVINAQGQPDRLVPAGTIVKIPPNNQNPEIVYTTLRDAVLPAGEDKVDGVLVVAQVPGTRGNALINTIRQFATLPFQGAAVANTQAFTTGTDVETDVQLRNRLKSYTASLARGTSSAILSAVIGLSDPDENKRVASAILTHPVAAGTPSILYVDDGSGFQPSFAGQAVDVLLAKANGTEQFLQLTNYPLPRPQVVNTEVGPFLMKDQMFLRLVVDGEEDMVVFTTSDFVNISVATTFEIVSAINAKSTLFKARLTNSSQNILLYPVNSDAETIQVVPLRDSDERSLYANDVLNFPTGEASFIALYQNSTRLRQRAKNASVETISYAAWNLLSPGNLIISVDGTPAQDGSFTLTDFPSVASFSLLTLEHWVAAFNAKFAGITATATPGQTLLISSNKEGGVASIEILGGTYQAPMFATNEMSSTGQASQFEINRQTGNIRILTDIAPGDSISAGVTDAKGFLVSSPSVAGTFNLDVDAKGRESQLVVVADSTKCNRIAVNAQVGDSLTVSDRGNSIMRILASTNVLLSNIQPGDFLYLASRNSGWLNGKNCGIFRVLTRGPHLTAGVDSYIEVHNNDIVAETATIADVGDVVAFRTDVYPQVWRASSLTTPVSTSVQALVDSLNKLQGLKASIFRTNSVKLTSTTEKDGSVAIPVAIGRVATIFSTSATAQLNNEPLIANKMPQKDLLGFPKPKAITSSNTFLARAAYPFVRGQLTANSVEDPPPYSGTYSEELTAAGTLTDDNVQLSDLVVFTKGDNQGVIKSIAAKTGTDSVGTQKGVPRTLFSHVTGDEVTLFQSLRFGADDSIIYVMDNDSVIKTVDVPLARTGKVNSGSGGATFVPTTTEFSANDSDNEAGIDFSKLSVWGLDINGTDFSDYAVLMRARNWYASGGTSATGAKMLLRSNEFGSNGNNLRFGIKYPVDPNKTATTVYTESPSFNLLTYQFGSGDARATGIPVNTNVTIAAGASGNLLDLTFSSGDFAAVQVGDVISLKVGSGISSWLLGQYGIRAKTGSTISILAKDKWTLAGQPAQETITEPAKVNIYPLSGTTGAEIVATINQSSAMSAVVVGSGAAALTASTAEDTYNWVNNATALACEHNPGEDSIALFDGINWVKSFQNSNPNFTLKSPLTLGASGVSTSIYSLTASPNEDGSTGEVFKLVPTTIKNIKHHLTQRALSQLPILSNVEIAKNGKRAQIVTKQLGSAGGIQVQGGTANTAQTDLLTDSRIAADDSGSYLLATVAAFPNSYAAGDIIKIQNRSGVRRKSTLTSFDSISVVADGSGFVDYLWNPKTVNFTPDTTITVTDVSSSYTDYSGQPLAPGMVFRWTHSAAGAESLARVKVGDLVAPYQMDTANGWPIENTALAPGEGVITGMPIIAVNDVAHYFDVVWPFGTPMSATAIGVGNIAITPTPQIRWNLPHSAPASVSDPTHTRYSLEVIGVNNLVQLRFKGGTSPRFADAGVAVDDYVVISGTTFNSLNNGIFRVLAVDNDSVIFENPNAVNDRNTLISFNNDNLPVSWTSNNNMVTGVIGAFSNLQTGVWVKKLGDDDILYRQVTGCDTGNYATATKLFLGAAYGGITGTAYGTSYNQETGFEAGVLLQSKNDVAFYEGDTVLTGDSLFAQQITNPNWFATNNSGNFEIVLTGTDASHRPFVRVRNQPGTSENDRLISVNTEGFYLVESNSNKFSSYRLIVNSSVNQDNDLRRSLYLLPDARPDKFSATNGTFITHTGKLGFDPNTTMGTDGYLFYTGLLRRVQRMVDGYGPDLTNFPEHKAIGSSIEAMPPLIKNLTVSLTVTTNQGSTIQDIGNNVKSAVINYVNSLGVGQDVILSSIIARVMQVRGVGAVTFNIPAPTQERISIAPNEKAVITADHISVN